MSENKKSWEDVINVLPDNLKDKFIKKLKDNINYNKESLSAFFELTTRIKINKPVIYIGAGTCGFAAGADMTIKKVEEYIGKKGIDADIIRVGCIGICSEEPLVDIQLPGKSRLSFSNVTEDKVDEIFDSFFSGKIPHDNILFQYRNDNTVKFDNIMFIDEHPFFAPQKRYILANCGFINPESIEECLGIGGYRAFLHCVNNLTHREVCNTVIDSGLRGRGGGGFLTGKKWEIALNQDAKEKYMICNADEGDPGAFMDRAIIEGDPHRLIEGLAIASYAIGAKKAYVYIRAEYPLAIKRLKKAIEDAKSFGLLGNNILDSGYSLDIIVKEGAGAFVCGEETALMNSIEGKRGMPRPRPPYPAVSGIFEKPTIINNVETMANVVEVINNGPDWFKSIGTQNSKGTKVFALSGKVNRTGLVEVAMGTTLKEIIYDIGGGIIGNKKFKAVQIGGPSGGCIPEQHIDIEVDYDSLKRLGAMMGSGGLVVMDEDNCMVDVAKFFMEFIQAESCGKCIPCREGTKRILEILNKITTHRRNEKKDDALIRFQGILQLESLAEVIRETSLCGLGQTAANPVLSTLRWFRDEYESHIFERKCNTKTCKEMLDYSIDADKCKGCMLCLKKCPTEAIIGKLKTAHYIVPEKCTGCGTCIEVCKFDAVKVS